MTRLTVEYDGTPFAGWARQPSGEPSVQGELERALATLLRRDIRLTVAGRTDRGVHAWGQIASYPGEPVRLQGLNALLPPEIAVLACDPAPEGFDARHDAVSRTYCYRILARRTPGAFEQGRALWWPRRVDTAALHACAAALRGRHDFTAFTPSGSGHRHFGRTVVDAHWEARGDELRFWIEADSFLRHMNRVLIGTMLEVSSGRRPVQGFTALLDGRPRSQAGVTAPAHALYLASVRYPDAVPSPSGSAGAAATTILPIP